MIKIGGSAPHFSCSGVVLGQLVELEWSQVHENRAVVLVFDSLARLHDSPGSLDALAQATGQLRNLGAKLAVVNRDPFAEALTRVSRSPRLPGEAKLVFPLLLDGDGHIATLYDLVGAELMPLWGHFLIDPTGTVRQAAVSGFPVDANLSALVRGVEALRFPPCGGAWN